MLADSSSLCSTEWDVYGGIRLVALIVGQSNATMVQETIQSLPYKQVICLLLGAVHQQGFQHGRDTPK